MDKKTLFQNITAVFGVLCIISLVFPYYVASASATVAGQSAQASESINGISFVTECGAWGIIFAVSLAAILVFNFIKQLEQFKKLINIIGAGLMIISLFSASSIASGAAGEASTAAVSVSLGHGLGFWITLLCSIGIAGVAIVNFLNLQGNPVFDAVNTSVDGEGTDGSAQSVNLSEAAEKVAGAAKNIAGTVSEKVGNLTDKAKAGKTAPAGTAAPVSAEEAAPAVSPVSAPAAVPHVQNAAPANIQSSENAAQNTIQVPSAESSAAAAKAMDSDAIMEKINKLFDMKEKGVLTEQEYNEKKAALLKLM